MSQDTQGKTVMCQGRIVWTSGDLFKGKPKVDQNTKQPKYDKQGNPAMEYGFGLAVPKAALNPGQVGADLWAAIQEQTYMLYPSRQLPPGYAWKYKDGDGIDHTGQPFSTREGHAGHLIFAMTTSLPIKFFRHENGGNIMINEGIKCGDYVNVQVTVKAHPPAGQGKAGLYLNPMAVQFLGYGKEIINAPSGDQIFGTQQVAMPAGASATPIAAQPGQMLVPQGQPFQQPAAPPQFNMHQQAAPMPAASPQPHYPVLPPQFQPPPGGQPMGNGYPQPGGFPAPGVAATPTGQVMGAPSFAAPVNQYQQPGFPPVPQ